MRFKVPFLRYAVGAIAFLLPIAVLAAVLPFIVRSEPIRAKLVREIASWTGGEVKVAGTVSLKNFFSLSVEMRDVEIGAFTGIKPLEGMKAERLVARVDWSDLLFGSFDFDKIRIDNAVFKLRAGSLEEAPGLYSELIASPGAKSFAAFVVDDSLVAVRSAERKPYRRLHVGSFVARAQKSGRRLATSASLIWRDRPIKLWLRSAFNAESGQRTPLAFRLDSPLLGVGFDGDALLSGGGEADGQFSLKAADPANAASWLGLDIGAAALTTGIDASGQVTLRDDLIAMTSGEVSLGGQTAQTGLTLKRGGGVPRLAGTLAFEHLDLSQPLADADRIGQLGARASLLTMIETDLRISARTVSRNGIEAGPLALALASRQSRVTAEIAEFDLLGGEVRGHIALDTAGPQTRASARLSAENLDAAALLSLAGQRDWLTGAADINVEAETAWSDPAAFMDKLVAKARINFPEGGQMRLDLPRLATTTQPLDAEGWGGFEFANAAFDKLRFEMTLRDGRIGFANVALSAAGREVSGRGQIDLAARSLDWRFTVAPGGAAQSGRTVIRGQAEKPLASRLSIKGPWSHPVIRSDDLPDSSMLAQPTRAAATLELSPSGR